MQRLAQSIFMVLLLVGAVIMLIVSTLVEEDTAPLPPAPSPQVELTCERPYIPPEPPAPTYNVPLSAELQKLVEDLCVKFDFNPATIYGMMYVESRFQNISSDDIHIGMMQINKNYFPFFVEQAEELQALPEEDRHPWNTTANTIAGIYALDIWRTECAKYGYYDERDWLESYNWGYTYFKMDPATCTYADKVYKALDVVTYEQQEDTPSNSETTTDH